MASTGVRGRVKLPARPEDFLVTHGEESIHIRPVPVAAVHRSGPARVRVLLFGGGPLVGWGLRDHNLGLAGRVADQLAARLHRGLELDVVADPDPCRQAAAAGLAGLRIGRYDAVVVMLGDPGTSASEKTVVYWTNELVRTLLLHGSSTSALLVCDSAQVSTSAQGLIGRKRNRVRGEQTRAALEASTRSGRVAFHELVAPVRQPPIGHPFDSSAFDEWGDAIVTRVIERLDLTHARAAVDDISSPTAEDEQRRQRALECLHIDRDYNARLQRIVTKAREMYGAAGAAINIIEDDVQWSKISVPPLAPASRTDSYCAVAIESGEPTLVNDTFLEPRFANSSFTTGQDPMRFYAAHPLRTWDGYRVGTLCIYGPTPRSMRVNELEALRDLAGLVEQELWSLALRTRAGTC